MSRTASGLRAWLVQRVTAIYLGVYLLYLLWHFLVFPPASFAEWHMWVTSPLVSTSLLLFLLALLLHTWVGLRDIVVDYIPIFAIRISVLALIALGLVSCGLWAAQIVLLSV